MYPDSDPRHRLPSAANGIPSDVAPMQYGLAHAGAAPGTVDDTGSRWVMRAQNFVVEYVRARPGTRLVRTDQPDEYAILLPRRNTRARLSDKSGTYETEGFALAFMPPGTSEIELPEGGEVYRLFSARTQDMAQRAANAAAFTDPQPHIPPYASWPEPPDGYRVRLYSLDVPEEEGRFSRIFRCTTMMLSVLDPQEGPRDLTRLSPHHHTDFEQGSIVTQGEARHHFRWPWGIDMRTWREDEHPVCQTGSMVVIPPYVTHTSRGIGPGVNQIVDVFAPPRTDFSEQPGWVLNAADYPASPAEDGVA